MLNILTKLILYTLHVSFAYSLFSKWCYRANDEHWASLASLILCLDLDRQQALHVSFLKFDTEPCPSSIPLPLPPLSYSWGGGHSPQAGLPGRRGHPASSPYGLPLRSSLALGATVRVSWWLDHEGVSCLPGDSGVSNMRLACDLRLSLTLGLNLARHGRVR
jgi:hypothetical protein